MKFIIARYKEDISWADNLNKDVIQKEVDLPNIGREPSSYLLWILNNYEKLNDEEEYVFCQGNPFDHSPNFLDEVRITNYYGGNHICDIQGRPDHPGLPMKEFCDKIGIKDTTFVFKAGCQFKLTKNQIRSIPYTVYIRMYNEIMENEIYCWVFERLPIYLWKHWSY